MVKKSFENILGSWAFLVGIVLAFVAGILSTMGGVDMEAPWMTTTLVILGTIIGLFNVTSKETNSFLMSGVVLIIASVFGIGTMAAVPVFSAILASLLIIFIPTTIVVAVKHVFNLAKN